MRPGSALVVFRIRAVRLLGYEPYADVAQLVEHNLAKVGVAGSNPVVRSNFGSSPRVDHLKGQSRLLGGG